VIVFESFVMRLILIFLTLLILPVRLFAADSSRIAIIDTAWDTRPYLAELKAQGVRVIGRYYARCEQENLPQKRFAFTSEAAEILAQGIGILSIYQYRSSSRYKFDGQRPDRQGNIVNLPDANCAPSKNGRNPRAEAALDVKAAIAQARQVGQPQGTAIYFGVDFNFSRADRATKAKMLAYFKTVSKAMRKAGYRLGAYGDGDALAVLQRARLIDYAWLMASAAFPGSSEFHRTGRWNLFQAQVDPHWIAGGKTCGKGGLPIDVDVQNPVTGSDAGFWGAGGVFELGPERLQAIHGARRFVCNGDARLRKTVHSNQDDLVSGDICRQGRRVEIPQVLKFLRPVRVGRIKGKLAEVDINEDGLFDGWTWVGNLSRDFGDKADYVFSSKKRAAARCR